MLVILRYSAPERRDSALPGLLDAALTAISGQAGHLRGWVGRSPDDPGHWLLASEWAEVGAMRRGLGSFDVKIALGPLQAFADQGSGVFEVLRYCDDLGTSVTPSSRATDADSAGPGS